MIEAQLRANGLRLQKAYDHMPYPVQNLLTSARGWFLVRNRYAPDMYAFLRELRSREAWSTEQVVAHQTQCLERIANHARATVPYYVDYPTVKFRTREDITQYPVLTREVVRENSQRLISTATPASECIRVGTTGTTGASLKVAFSEKVARRHWAFRMRQWAWAGVETRAPRITLFGSRIVPPERIEPPFWTHNYLERQTLVSIFHLSETTSRHYVGFLRRNSGKVLEGFPSVLGIVADFVLQTGKAIPMRAVFTDGEPLYPFLRENIEKAFTTRAFDLYGNTEYAGLISECEKGQMHAIPDYSYLEILDDKNQPVKTGEEGHLVWTGFINDTMPLIRYRIGDRGCWQTNTTCECGRNFPLVIPTITRDGDTLRCPDGRLFSPRALNQSLKSAMSLRFCQLVHERPGHVVIRGVSTSPEAYGDLMDIQKSLQKVLGTHFVVSAMLAEAPIVRAGGKIPLIIQQATAQ
jgi:phenylacetate-CoA ligase